MIGEIQFKIDVIDKPFEREGLSTLSKTVQVKRYFEDQEISSYRYGWLDKEEVYDLIAKKEAFSLDQCFVENFSLAEYRKKHQLDDRAIVEVRVSSAQRAFFRADQVTDFSFARFPDSGVNFRQSIFFLGNLSFYHAQFHEGSSSFSDCHFVVENINFQFAQFDNGDISFESAIVSGNSMSFINTRFGAGDVNFKECNFGKSDVSFHYAKFDTGDISFDKAIFKGGNVDFRTIEFGSGKVEFRRVHFGDGQVTFEESEFKNGKISFRSSVFGEGEKNFSLVDFGDNKVSFEGVDFGTGKISFAESRFKSLVLRSTQLVAMLDLRIAKGDSIDLSNAFARDIIYLKRTNKKFQLRELNLNGLENLGRIFLDWKANNVHSLIASQRGTSNREKSLQFNVLKEAFHQNGQYDDEDRAYVAFKRYELKADTKEMIGGNSLNALWVYPMNWFKLVIFDKCGLYATDPLRVMVSMTVMYILFSLLYVGLIHADFIHADIVSSVGDPDKLTIMEKSFYHSAITFLTIGYGDYYPSGHIRWLSSVEGWVGLFMMAYFTVAFVRKILR